MIFLIYHQALNQVHNKIQQAPDCELQLEGKQVPLRSTGSRTLQGVQVPPRTLLPCSKFGGS